MILFKLIGQLTSHTNLISKHPTMVIV